MKDKQFLFLFKKSVLLEIFIIFFVIFIFVSFNLKSDIGYLMFAVCILFKFYTGCYKLESQEQNRDSKRVKYEQSCATFMVLKNLKKLWI